MLHLTVFLACRSPADTGSLPTDTQAPDTATDTPPADTDTADTGGETGTPEKPDLPIASVTVVDGASGDMLGWSLSRIRDQDGDGQGDVVIGAPGHQSFTGAVYRFSSADLDGELSLKEATLVFTGSSTSGYAGSSLATGDLDGDGRDDLLIGAPSLEQTTGAVYLLSGTLSGEVSEEDGAVLTGRVTGGGFGVRLATGDLSGDGSLEVVVSATSDGTAQSEGGAVYLFAGDEERALVLADEEGQQLGVGLAVADLNGDGIDDLAVGGPSERPGNDGSGDVGVLWGPLSGSISLEDADVRLSGEQHGDHLGNALAAGEDLDGDGIGDLAVSAYWESSRKQRNGAVYVFSGPPRGSGPGDAQATLYGENLYGYGGISIAMLADTVGDAHADLLVGEYGVSRAHLFEGPLVGNVDFSQAASSLSGKKDPGFGYTVASGGALGGGPRTDLLIGDHQHGEGGRAYLYSGDDL